MLTRCNALSPMRDQSRRFETVLEISNIGILTALAAGAISFPSPCVLLLAPGCICCMVGNPGVDRPYRAVGSRLSILLFGILFAPAFRPYS